MDPRIKSGGDEGVMVAGRRLTRRPVMPRLGRGIQYPPASASEPLGRRLLDCLIKSGNDGWGELIVIGSVPIPASVHL